jgi:quinohemoprotein ethanol dehydrogenase
MTYEVDGVQYIAILSGAGGGGWQVPRPAMVSFRRGNDNRILVFRLDGGVTPIPPEVAPPGPLPEPPEPTGTPEDIAAGAALYGRDCGGCHLNAPGTPVPDLRRSPMIRDAAVFASVVRDGVLQKRGMPAWDDLQTAAQTEQIRAHIINVARLAFEAQQKAVSLPAAPPAPREGGH